VWDSRPCRHSLKRRRIMAFCCSCGREVGEAGTCPICGAPQRATLEPRPQAAAGTCAANRPSTSGETEKKTAKYHKEPGLNWADAARLLATIAFVNISRYYGWQSVIGFLLLARGVPAPLLVVDAVSQIPLAASSPTTLGDSQSLVGLQNKAVRLLPDLSGLRPSGSDPCGISCGRAIGH